MNKLLSDTKKHIVVVDDNPVNLDLAESVLKETYKITKLISGEQLLKFLQRIRPDLILLDIQMPGLTGYETIIEIKKNPALKGIPVIFITGQKDTASESEGFRLGAQDFIGKPFNPEVALARIKSQLELVGYRNHLEELVREKTKRIDDLQHIVTISWAEMVESRDGTTGSHVKKTSKYYEILLRLLAEQPRYKAFLTEEFIADFVRGSIIHDIGKIGISDQVLKKPGPLSKEEFELMKEHSHIGAEMIQKIMERAQIYNFLEYAKELALCHHERWDGTGYPYGLKGEEIPLYVRALSLADVYEALTSVRPYKKAFAHEEAMKIIRGESGKFFCPDVFAVFEENQEVFRTEMENKNE